ncbi:MAG: hypothetical protein JNK05_02310 [Myxococcales bacterium]|nr:hypothetical protein [Myxococcales bacterium]
MCRVLDAAGIDRDVRPSDAGYDDVDLAELVGSRATLGALRLRIQCPEPVPRNQPPSLEYRVARSLASKVTAPCVQWFAPDPLRPPLDEMPRVGLRAFERAVEAALAEHLHQTTCPPDCTLEPAESAQRAARLSLGVEHLMAGSIDALASSWRTVEDRGFERRPRRTRRRAPRSSER